MERARQEVNLELRKRLWILGTVGATAPFIGLFGTVVGIMNAFRHMAQTGQGGFAVVASGISEALITTAGGIAVAISAVVLYNAFNVHAQKLTVQLRLLTEEVLEAIAEVLPALGPAGAPRAAAAKEG
jgi:biopolymer transport protein ExbB